MGNELSGILLGLASLGMLIFNFAVWLMERFAGIEKDFKEKKL